MTQDPDTCQEGACELHEGDPCVGSLCDEEGRRCVGCIDKDDCDDNNPCTDDVCELGFCSNNVTEGSCDDGLFCNGPDICQGGVCEPL
ncbi:MAG: hypothetical protein AAFX99_14685, partial [Myxococcota bacterium]